MSGPNLSRRALLAGAALTGAAGLMPVSGCAASGQWRESILDAEPQTLTGIARGLLVGTSGPGLIGPTGRIPVQPVTPYGREAGWVSLAASADRLAGIGMTHGGAHSNPRWSVFTGTTSALVERQQDFEVFHGWGAGQLAGVTFASSGPVIVGSWQSRSAGNDIEVWVTDQERWRRLSPATPLSATPDALPQANAVAGGSRLMIVGQVIELSPLRTRAVAWTATDPAGGWERIDLPHDAARATAHDVAPLTDGWLVAGRADDRLALWRIDAALTAAPVSAPELLGEGAVRVAAAGDQALVAVSARGGVRTLLGRPGAWSRTVQPGEQAVAAGWGAAPAVITRTGGQRNRIFELS